MPDELSVRQWQEQFRAGAFNAQDRYTQCRAGWYDWFCQDHALAGRLKKIGRVVMGITDPFILDNYYVWFKNNCPLNGPLYDDVRFEPLSGERGGKYFVVSLDSPHEREKWALVTERYGFDAPEFDCRNIREMVKYINSIGPELQQGIVPPFIAEKDAVTAYTRLRGGTGRYPHLPGRESPFQLCAPERSADEDRPDGGQPGGCPARFCFGAGPFHQGDVCLLPGGCGASTAQSAKGSGAASQKERTGAMNAAFDFPRAAEALTAYAVERQAGFAQHQGHQFRQPEERNRWIRGILRGMAEVCGADMDAPVCQFDQRLEDAHGCFAVEALGLPEQRHTIQSLRRYADQLDLMNGDQRERMMEVKNLLEDITVYLSWNVSRTGVYDAREQVESQLLRMTARRPIRFTRVLVGGDLDPGGTEFVSGLADSADDVRGTEMFQKTAQEYPERREWPAICTVYLGGGREFAVGTIDADELDMAVIRETGDRFLKRPGVRPVCSRELRVLVHRETKIKSHKKREAER